MARALVPVLVGITAADAGAQAAGSSAKRGEPASLPRRLGVDYSSRLLESGTLAGRLRAIARLSGLGTDRALDRLTTFALERRAELGAREWLAIARGLAPHVARGGAELVLATLMNQRPSPEASPDDLALFELARSSAAMALAASGRASALATLGRALRTGGDGARLAARALVAHPPAALAPLLDVPGEPSVELARLLGALGDERAFHPLRAWVRGESAEVRASAALALLELGHMETVPLARKWLAQPLAVLRRAALRILMAAGEPEATRALVAELQRDPNDRELLELALAFPSPELAAVAEQQLEALGAAADAPAWWTLLARAGSERGFARLEAALGEPEAALAAAHALSRSADTRARAALERALSNDRARDLVVRALAARCWSRRERSGALSARLSELERSTSFSDRWLAAFARSLEGTEAAQRELESGDEARIIGAAGNALAFDESVLARAASLLESAAPGRVRSALSVVLLRPRGRQAVTSELLRELIAEEGAARPLALRALAARDAAAAVVRRYLDHPDPLLRAHVARGLGEGEAPGAVGLLARRYEFEVDPSVRLAIVYALGARGGTAAERALSLAAQLDGDDAVRSAARLALSGTPLGDPSPQNELFWAELRVATGGAELSGARDSVSALDAGSLEPKPPEARAAAGSRQESAAPAEPAGALLNVAPGLAFPVFVDARGVLVVAGVGLTILGIRLL